MNKLVNKPDFIVVGGHKCGTTSLHYYLAQHPQIFMPTIKGTDFFSREGLLDKQGKPLKMTTIKEYITLYDEITTEKVAGEVSSVYLRSKKACINIQKYLPQVKLIVILRNPVDRAFSHFNMNSQINTGKINTNFDDLLNNKHILQNGFYSSYLEMYFDKFKREQIKILLFDDFQKNKERFFSEFFAFIEVDVNFIPDTSVIMRKGGEKNNTFKFLFNKNFRSIVGKILKPFTTPEQRRILAIKAQNLSTKKNILPNDIRQELINIYREDILKVQNMLNIDLAHWL